MRITRIVCSIAAVLIVSSMAAQGQESTTNSDMSIDPVTRTEVVEGLAQALQDFYVFPDEGLAMAAQVRRKQAQHGYDSITSARQLADMLTHDLREVSHDRHLAVHYSQSVVRPFPFPPPPPPVELVSRQQQTFSRANFGFAKVEILTGNVGYLDLRGFMPPAWIGDTLVGTMAFVQNTDALIIDLRHNGGGSPDSVLLIASYFFDEPVHMNDIYTRPSNETRQYWTLPYVPGKRFLSKSVYILTSSNTFSAAEDFTYAMKNLKRATVIGESTGGGAHPVGNRRVADHFLVTVPMGRSISPITHQDWEGVGVQPDVKVPAQNALDHAHLIALEKIKSESRDETTRAEISAEIERLKTRQASPE